MTLILLHIRDDEAQVRRHQTFRRGLIAFLGQTGQSTLFRGVSDERQLLDVVQVLVEGRGRSGTEEAFGTSFRSPGGGSCLHTPSPYVNFEIGTRKPRLGGSATIMFRDGPVNKNFQSMTFLRTEPTLS